jgi:hypothetical protein
VKSASRYRSTVIVLPFLLCITSGLSSWQQTRAQSVPYARAYARPKEAVESALKELAAYSGQKLPVVDGFVATTEHSLDRYEHAYYQMSIDLLPGPSAGTIVRLTAKITAWYADRDPSKSGYQVLPSNGRLELDLLDRLGERLGEKPVGSVLKSQVQAPAPKIDLSTGLPRSPSVSGKGGSAVAATPASPPTTTADTTSTETVSMLHAKRESEEKRLQQLTTELKNLQEIERGQAHPANLVFVKKSGTPILARPTDTSSVLFTAAEDDEFEFLDVKGDWVHVQISGVSRGYIRRSNLELPEVVAERFNSPNGTSEVFRLEREEFSTFPGDWSALRGKLVKIFTVQPVLQDRQQTGPKAKLLFASSLLKDFSAKLAPATPQIEGVVIIFDSSDGGMIGSTIIDMHQLSGGSLSVDDFWKRCYLDPPDAFRLPGTP